MARVVLYLGREYYVLQDLGGKLVIGLKDPNVGAAVMIVPEHYVEDV